VASEMVEADLVGALAAAIRPPEDIDTDGG
jgi:hypothetical protein